MSNRGQIGSVTRCSTENIVSSVVINDWVKSIAKHQDRDWRVDVECNGTLQMLQITDQINTANSQTCNYGYDDLVRITSANCGSVFAQTFGFDPFGNLSQTGSASFLPLYTGSGTSTAPTNQYYSIPGGPSGASNYFDTNGNLRTTSRTRTLGMRTETWRASIQPA